MLFVANPDPVEGAYSAPPDPLAGFKGAYFSANLLTVAYCSLLPVHERGTAYHLTFEHLHRHSTRLRNM